MRFYIASGLQNSALVKKLFAGLERNGHIVSYNWTLNGDVRNRGYDILFETAYKEVFAASDADFVLVILPGGLGTHVELGLALASRNNKRIVVWSETGAEFTDGDDTCVFYHHTAIERKTGSTDELEAFMYSI